MLNSFEELLYIFKYTSSSSNISCINSPIKKHKTRCVQGQALTLLGVFLIVQETLM